MNIKHKIIHSILERLPEALAFEIKKIHYLRSLKKFSERNEKDLTILKHIVKLGDHVVDIGANIGWYTKALSNLVGEKGCVFSIEPVPPTFELLSFCAKKLRLRNVKLLNCAISEGDGTAIMEVPKYERGGENFYQSKIIKRKNINHSLKHYMVDLKSIDSLFSILSNRISFIKCDVEGHELQVIEGARKVISNFKPAWLIEISGNPEMKDSDTFKVFNIFEREGYKAWWFDSKKLREYSPDDRSTNYFFLTENHITSVFRKKDLYVF
jgi:FkbM family methyltransferase